MHHRSIPIIVIFLISILMFMPEVCAKFAVSSNLCLYTSF